MPDRLRGRARLLPPRRRAPDGPASHARGVAEIASPSFTIRDATSDDRAAIVDLYLQLKRHHAELVPDADRYTVSDERWTHMVAKDFDDPGVHFLVAEDDARPIAFARFLYEEKSQGKACEVETLVVDEGIRGRRVGAAVLAHVEERARRDGATGMRVNVLNANADGRRFYERSGYETVAVRYAKKL